MNQSELEANTYRPCQARENAREQVTIGIGQGSDARFFNQSQSVAMQNQSNCGIAFDTQMKSALIMKTRYFRRDIVPLINSAITKLRCFTFFAPSLPFPTPPPRDSTVPVETRPAPLTVCFHTKKNNKIKQTTTIIIQHIGHKTLDVRGST